MITTEIIEQCKNGDRKGQYALYKLLAPKMMAVCLRYLRYREDAEDALQVAFVKIFKYIHTFNFSGPFPAWARRIVVGVAIDHYHKKNKNKFIQYEDSNESASINQPSDENILASFDANELLETLNKLPESFRLILNLYAIEGYAHKEIAEMLQISEGTSRSQLSRARAMLTEQCSPKVKEIQHGV